MGHGSGAGHAVQTWAQVWAVDGSRLESEGTWANHLQARGGGVSPLAWSVVGLLGTSDESLVNHLRC
jgi:hypothetical protein